jgi:hypothetical protein
VHDATIKKIDSKQSQIGKDERPGGGSIDLRQNIGTNDPGKYAGNGNPKEELPIDVAVRDMADAGNGRGEGFCRVDAGRRNGGWNADTEQYGAGDLSERHSKRAVDHLRHESDQDEGQQGGRISQDIGENFARSTLFIGI